MWTIEGEENKALGLGERPTPEVAQNMVITYESLQPDVLSWTVTGQRPDLADLTLPELGERLILRRAGEGRFSGIVTAIPVMVSGSGTTVSITAEGPDWWLENTPLTDLLQDDSGEESDRPVFTFEKGDLIGHIERLFSRAKTLGLPVDLGGLEACYEVPKMTLNGGSFLSALTALLRVVPDAITWWDYRGETPLFRLSRRSTAESLDLVYGQAPFVSASLRPRLGLEAEEVAVNWTERAIDGTLRFKSQKAGESSIGTRQTLLTSAASIADILPPDPIEGINLTSGPMRDNLLEIDTLQEVWPFWNAWQSRHTGIDAVLRLWQDGQGASVSYNRGMAPEYYQESGERVTSASDLSDVIFTPLSSIPSWLIDVVPYEEVNLRGTVYIEATTGPGEFPEWLGDAINAGVTVSTQQVTGGGLNYFIFYDLDVQLAAIQAESGSFDDRRFWQPLAYQYNTPPAEFAQNLLAAQSYTPYQGTLLLTEADAGSSDPRGKVVNIKGAVPEWEAMRALVQGVSVTLSDGSQSIRLGSPQSLSLTDIVTRQRVSPQDNVQLL